MNTGRNFSSEKRHQKYLVAGGIIILILVTGTIAQGFAPKGGVSESVAIDPGTSRWAVAQELVRKQVIRSSADFLLLSVLKGGHIEAGTYTLNPNQTPVSILDMIQTGRSRYITITIPEGWRREQIAIGLTQKGLDGTGFLTVTTDKEGYLFPDTYFLLLQATPQQIVDKFSTDFSVRTKDLNPTREQIILASIVEREAKKDNERSLIAGIYLNRIKLGMNLEADPTVQYAKDSNLLAAGQPVKKFWQPITVADYQNVISPYNTYLNKSYPPGPICNPGIKSITAAVKPTLTDALYFFHTADGTIITSRTLEEHNANKKKYL